MTEKEQKEVIRLHNANNIRNAVVLILKSIISLQENNIDKKLCQSLRESEKKLVEIAVELEEKTQIEGEAEND